VTSRACVRVRARGRVQGVGFRVWLARRAEQRGLDGWVRNLPDGSVEAVLAGERSAVAGMVDLVRAGPRGSWVEDVEVTDEAEPPAAGFSIS
jgi:acylphosphatase